MLIPAFSLGRAQIVVYYLQEWMESGRMPRVPLYVDSPLAASIADVYQRHPDHLAPQTLHRLAEAPHGPVHYVRSLAESRELSRAVNRASSWPPAACARRAASCAIWKNNIDDPRCSIVLVSYQAPQSLGHRLLERGPTVPFDGKTLEQVGRGDRPQRLLRPRRPQRPAGAAEAVGRPDKSAVGAWQPGTRDGAGQGHAQAGFQGCRDSSPRAREWR